MRGIKNQHTQGEQAFENCPLPVASRIELAFAVEPR